MTATISTERTALVRGLRRRDREYRRARKVQDREEQAVPEVEAPELEIPPGDPCLAYFQSNPEPIDLDTLKVDTPGIRALRDEVSRDEEVEGLRVTATQTFQPAFVGVTLAPADAEVRS